MAPSNNDNIPEPSRKRRRLLSVITKEVVAVVHSVNDFMREERDSGKRISLARVRDRTSLATGIGVVNISKIMKCDNWKEWEAAADNKRPRDSVVPDVFVPIVRLVIRDMMITQKKMPTVSRIYEELPEDAKRDESAYSDLIIGTPTERLPWDYSRATLRL